jgi:hypothetical protein
MSLTRVLSYLSAAALTFGVASGMTAGAAYASEENSVDAAYSKHCETGRVASVASNLPIRYEPLHGSPLITTAQRGYEYNCVRDRYALGDRYTACGVTNANGWILIRFNSGLVGFTYMTCLEDV